VIYEIKHYPHKKAVSLFILLWLLIVGLIASIIFAYGVNPFFAPNQKTALPMRLYYPPPENGIVQPLWVYVNFTLVADNKIAENTEIRFTDVTGELFVGNIKNISYVAVGFYNTNAPDTKQYFPIGANPPNPHFIVSGVILSPNESNFLVPKWSTTFSFLNAGDYSPTIVVGTQNSNQTIVEQYTFDNIKIHVVIAIALLGFTFAESVEWLKKYLNKNRMIDYE
jgi:hypothetical protein